MEFSWAGCILPGTCNGSGLHPGEPPARLVSRVVTALSLVGFLFVTCAERCPSLQLGSRSPCANPGMKFP